MTKTGLLYLLVFVLALGAYEIFNRQRAAETIEMARQAASEAATRAANEVARNTAGDAAKAASEAVANEFAKAKAANAELVAKHKRAAFVVDGLATASMVKVSVAEYFQRHGELPASNYDAGLPAADRFRGVSLTGVEVLWGGVITLTYDEKSGVQGGTITFAPDPNSLDDASLRWRCESSSYQDIETWAPTCTYRP